MRSTKSVLVTRMMSSTWDPLFSSFLPASRLITALLCFWITASHAQLCQDSKTFTFSLLDKVDITRNCSWILKNTNDNRDMKRKGRYCPLTHVKYACPLSCDACDESCEDNPYYLFQNENGETKNCAWIAQEDVELRRMIYCNYARDSSHGTSTSTFSGTGTASEIADNCVASCGFCKGDFGIVPSEVAWEQVGTDSFGKKDDTEVGLSTFLSGDGKVVAVGFRNVNHSYIYRLFYQSYNDKWYQIGDDIEFYFRHYNMGTKTNALSNDGKTFAVQTGSSAARVYRWDGYSWHPLGSDFTFDDELDIVTYSLSGDGKVVVFVHSTTLNGTTVEDLHTIVMVYRWDGSFWKEYNLELVGDGGQDTGGANEVASNHLLSTFGLNLNDDGSAIAILSDQEMEDNSTNTFVHVYEWTGFSWCQKGNHIMLKKGIFFTNLLTNVVMSEDGNVLAIGPEVTFTEQHGSFVRVYEWDGVSWNQRGLNIDGTKGMGNLDEFSIVTMTMSADGNVVTLGIVVFTQSTFVVVVCRWDGFVWNSIGKNSISNNASFDIINTSYSVSSNNDGTRIALGVAGNPFAFAKVYKATRGIGAMPI